MIGGALAARTGRAPRAVVALLALAASATAQTRIGDVTALVDCPWPQVVDRGYLPVFVELENEAAERRRVDLQGTYRGWGTETVGARSVVLEPNSVQRVEVLVPTFTTRGGGSSYGSWNFLVQTGGDTTYLNLEPSPAYWTPGARNLMVFSPAELGGVDRAMLESAVATPPPRGTFAPIPAPLHATLVRDFRPSLGYARFDRLPSSSTGYTSLHVVALDARRERPSDEALDPLFAWVRTGGTLVAFSAEPGGADLASLPFLEGAFEERFRQAEFEGGALYRHGLGRLYLVDGHAGELFEDAAAAVLIDALLEVHDQAGAAAPWVPSSMGNWRLKSAELPIPGLRRLPLRAFLLLLVAFAVVIGPVNLMTLRRIGRPGLLLVTIPVISAIASLGILAYGILHQGLDTKVARHSRTVLDQRTARASTVEWRTTFVGLSPGRGLRPHAGTTVVPRYVADEGERYSIDQTGGTELGGSFLPVRTPVEQVLVGERAARLHLAFDVGADGTWTVHNRLEVPLERLWLVDLDGDSHFARGIAPGASATLTPGVQGDGAALLVGALFRGAPPIPGTYLARAPESPFVDDCELGLNVLAGAHLIQGVLPADAKDWSR